MKKFEIKSKYFKKKLNTNKNYKTFFIKKGNLGINISKNKNYSINLIEALRRIIRKPLKKNIKLLRKNVLNFNKTKKALGIRMGKGKGKIDKKYFFMQYGEILYEINEIIYDKVYIKKYISFLKIKSKIGKKYKIYNIIY